ncbi:MAG: FAD-dependent oxidoreductase [Ichthyobacteriaceae bacterium]|nr:FAD-dependent oxidoreductase [Ichthyobacteriaceae bacterium]
MKYTDILVIGGSAAGVAAATTAKTHNNDKKVLVVRKEDEAMVPCGIPYIFGSLDDSSKNIMPKQGLYNAGVDLIIDEVVAIDEVEKNVTLGSGEIIFYDKLIIATGSTPTVPKWLAGRDLDNVYYIPKNKVYLDKFKEKLETLQKVIVIGAGFIGVEMSDELVKGGKDVTLVEIQENILSLAFDKHVAVAIEEIVKSEGVTLITGNGISEIIGKDGKVSAVKLQNGDILEADAVVLSTGYKPNTKLAELIKLPLNRKGFIKVDHYMRTDIKDIFAVGDCAEKRDFFTRKSSGAMLASIATAEARVAAMNLYKLSSLSAINGTLTIFATSLAGKGFGAAGLTESQATAEGFNVVTGTFEGFDKHPHTLPGTSKQIVKLIVSRETGIILGGEVLGGMSAGELTNVVGFIIQNRMTVSALLTSQIGTQPLLTGSPVRYTLIKAADMVIKNMNK